MRRMSIALGVLCVLWWCVPCPPLLNGIPFSQAVFDRHQQLLRLTLAADEQYRLPIASTQVAPALLESILRKEDQYYFWHPGVNPYALLRGAWRLLRGEARSGGSTLTMQVARMRLHLHTRSFAGKLRQIFWALCYERHYRKSEILTAYLTLAPFGRNIEGVAAASEIYFAKSAASLSVPEAIALAVIPQHPARRVLPSREHLLDAYLQKHPDQRAHRSLFLLPLRIRTPAELPFAAPHFVNSVLSRHAHTAQLVTTLDLELQRMSERTLHAYVQQHAPQGIRNAAALLLNWRTMEIEAAVGSADFFDASIDGQVNGFRARRSPGSTLKPFVYALALDQGLINSETMLKDSPANFGGYDPENFDREFFGPISAELALTLSRNVPAVTLASQLHQPSLYGFLQQTHIRKLRSESFYGLSSALGGTEVTMEELVQLYAALARGGQWARARSLLTARPVRGERVLSPEAAFIVHDMLRRVPPPDGYTRLSPTTAPLDLAWKTGTSFAFRDAWSVGIVGPYILAIWIGNFNSRSDPVFVGRRIAAPLFFHIVQQLQPRLHDSIATETTPSLNLQRVPVCAVSGDLPGPDCPATKPAWFIPGRSPIRTCAIHRRITLNPATGRRACASSGETSNAQSAVYEFWPSDVLALFKLAGVPRATPPPFDADCDLTAQATHGAAPRIITPQANVTYALRVHHDESRRIAFKAISDADVHELYWFVNEQLIGKTPRNNTLFWDARPGDFHVRVVDDNGRAVEQPLQVQLVE